MGLNVHRLTDSRVGRVVGEQGESHTGAASPLSGRMGVRPDVPFPHRLPFRIKLSVSTVPRESRPPARFLYRASKRFGAERSPAEAIPATDTHKPLWLLLLRKHHGLIRSHTAKQ
ncbi:hypothetical protein SKAU_G00045690 [Synaphobranchus kaupii]|uniref:Uncharacterized protein n=1 Tax=Synaphobranchus kaupii TaxID=118154 RepID=A0A9Q1G312_SYNKA|nr:hypothetical protein SKAU_G00045690 [Synaphobranchus kaupii]